MADAEAPRVRLAKSASVEAESVGEGANANDAAPVDIGADHQADETKKDSSEAA